MRNAAPHTATPQRRRAPLDITLVLVVIAVVVSAGTAIAFAR
ncbi:hypothetical protein [Actinomadura macra]|nr:hypothetical protein [Actinomadura macra]